ncbi:ankyrin repeat domain-containing protein [Flavobacterium myungsuense]|uniref:Ankyrin repeat domain-containing protein n=1 Tax=Flavobacterium myungsuense TaxID=651823 RepID=A0ABW3IYK1_9FLAO
MFKTFLIISFLIVFQFSFSQEEVDVFDVARAGTVEEVKEILKSNPKAFIVVNKEGFSPLILACYRGNNEVAKFLINNGSDLNVSGTMGTALMAAVVKGNDEIVKILLDKNADINATDANGTTALMYAVQFQNEYLIKLLLEHKADRSRIDKNGKTAFEFAVFSKNEAIINLLK